MTEEKKTSGGKYPGYAMFELSDTPSGYSKQGLYLQGWDLLEVLPESKVTGGEEQRNTYGEVIGEPLPPMVINIHRYLFGLSEDNAILKVRGEVEAKEAERFRLEEENQELLENIESLKKLLEEQKAQTANAERDALNHKNNAKKAQDEMVSAKIERKLAQAHLKKVTLHYGEAAIDKIINPPKPQKGNDPANRKVAL